jgi:hypothetical protein
MRAAQLLAVGVFCLLASSIAGCGRVVQPVGEYAAEEVRAGSGTLHAGRGGNIGGGGAGGEPADAGTGMDAGPPLSSDDKCTFTSLTTERHRLDLYLMIDSNITLAPTGQ